MAVSYFLLVRVLIDFMGVRNYGVWLTISTFTAWFSFFDFGFGNGLRNKLVELLSKGDKATAKIYVSTVYFTFLVIFIGIYLLIGISSFFIDWARVLNAVGYLEKILIITINISFFGLCLKLILSLINAILLADLKNAMTDGINMIQQVLILLLVIFLKPIITHPVVTVAFISAAIPILVLLGVSFFLFQKKYTDISPSIKYIDINRLADLKGLGLNFFVIQIAGMVIFSSQNFVVAHFFDSETVTTYNIVFRYFGILTLLAAVILAPFWSMVTKAFTLKDFDWIKVSISRLLKLWVFVVFIAIIMVLASEKVYSTWINKDIHIPIGFTICMAIYTIVTIWNGIFANFINGVGKIKLQLYLALFGMLIYLPLCILLVKYLHLGLLGVAIGSTVSLLAGSLVLPIQYLKIITQRATGIWNA
jgi:O-antigen/teichoic acid export membrane protein